MTIVVVGTAGHVDHGKSALVERLTGVKGDRLPEERRRGMTIDLGFAHATLPGGIVASFVDVPGHEDFIRNMIAGAGGVRAALVVVAADEGVMPQTREHVAILHLLGVSHGVVALSKADLIEDEDELTLVADDVTDLLAGTSLAGIPIVPVSSLTGTGLDTFVVALSDALRRAGQAPDQGRPRMAVDRVFSKIGFGTVVTGTLRDGEFHLGDDLLLALLGVPVKVRGLHSHGSSVETAPPGSRVAVNLKGSVGEGAARGDWLVHHADYPLTRLIDVAVELLPGVGARLTHDDAVIAFAGCAAVPARVRLLGAASLAEGHTGFAQLVLSSAIVAAAGDRIVLRRPSPGATIGGATILDPAPPRRHRRFAAATTDRLTLLQSSDAETRLRAAIAVREPCTQAVLTPAVVGLSEATRNKALSRLVEAGRVKVYADTLLTAEGDDRLSERAQRRLGAYHARHPDEPGPPREELRTRVALNRAAFSEWLTQAAQAGWLVVEGHAVRLAGHRGTSDPAADASADRLLERMRAQRFTPPSPHELDAEFGARVVAGLVRRGELVRLSDAVVLDRSAHDALCAMATNHLRDHESISVAELRDLAQTSRRVVLAVLERLDSQRVTRREGDVRVRGPSFRTVDRSAEPNDRDQRP